MSNTAAYAVGMARLYWSTIKGTVATQVDSVLGAVMSASRTLFGGYELGNVVAAELNPDVTYLDHFVAVAGQRRKDKSVAITKSINIPITFDEVSATNLTNFFAASPLSATRHAIMTQDTDPPEGVGVLAFYTDTGKDFLYVIPKANIKAEGGLSFNMEDWMNVPMSIEVLHHSTYNAQNTSTACPYGFISLPTKSTSAPGV
jgi:hypothetical protein